jgi:hypothetical protein
MNLRFTNKFTKSTLNVPNPATAGDIANISNIGYVTPELVRDVLLALIQNGNGTNWYFNADTNKLQVNIDLSDIEVSVDIGSGIKKTGVDSGTLNQISIDDDHIYICVEAGDNNTAIWKRVALSQT